MTIPLSVFNKLLDAAIEAGRAGDQQTLDAINERVADVNVHFVVDAGRMYMVDNASNVAIASENLVRIKAAYR